MWRANLLNPTIIERVDELMLGAFSIWHLAVVLVTVFVVITCVLLHVD